MFSGETGKNFFFEGVGLLLLKTVSYLELLI